MPLIIRKLSTSSDAWPYYKRSFCKSSNIRPHSREHRLSERCYHICLMWYNAERPPPHPAKTSPRCGNYDGSKWKQRRPHTWFYTVFHFSISFRSIRPSSEHTEFNIKVKTLHGTKCGEISAFIWHVEKKRSEWMFTIKVLFWMKNQSNSIEWCRNLRYTSIWLSTIYTMWGIVRLSDWTEGGNWNSNAAVLGQHLL